MGSFELSKDMMDALRRAEQIRDDAQMNGVRESELPDAYSLAQGLNGYRPK